MVELRRMQFSLHTGEVPDTAFGKDVEPIYGQRYTTIDTPWMHSTTTTFAMLREFGLDISDPEKLRGMRFTIEVANGKAEYEVDMMNRHQEMVTIRLISGEKWPINDKGERVDEEGR